MPSIEIVCLGQESSTRFRGVPFAVKSETEELRSHRHPSRFQRDFDRMRGSIYHLGCPHLRRSRGGSFEAYELLSRKCRNQWPRVVFLEFDRPFVPGLKKMLSMLLSQSSFGRVVFTSDYAFSPNRSKRIKQISFERFWGFHRKKRLRFNTLYTIISHP